MISSQYTRSFRSALLRWYRRNGRDLPWRLTRDPYAVLVSEFMLQQTQVATVLPYYNEWLRQFPDFAVLGRAPESLVLRVWQGLGYYARARNLHATAKAIIHRYGESFPNSIEQMRELPGIGKYTAHAMATFVFDQSVPVVDANIARVIARLFDLRQPIDSAAGRGKIWHYAADLLPAGGAAAHNSALMDLGALVCTARVPKCGICPVKKFCRAKTPAALPIKRPRLDTIRLTEAHAFVVRQQKIVLEQSARRWHGLWILPPLKTRSTSNGAIHISSFPFTNHRITLKIFAQRLHKIDKRRQRWIEIESLDSIPIPSPHRRAINALLSRRTN